MRNCNWTTKLKTNIYIKVKNKNQKTWEQGIQLKYQKQKRTNVYFLGEERNKKKKTVIDHPLPACTIHSGRGRNITSNIVVESSIPTPNTTTHNVQMTQIMSTSKHAPIIFFLIFYIIQIQKYPLLLQNITKKPRYKN
jgi:hypothetical protein